MGRELSQNYFSISVLFLLLRCCKVHVMCLQLHALNFRRTAYMQYFLIAPLTSSALTLAFGFSNAQHVDFRFVPQPLTAGILGSQAGFSFLLVYPLLIRLFFLPTEQRKKYSNSNFIMHETSQYHVEVRCVFCLFLWKY